MSYYWTIIRLLLINLLKTIIRDVVRRPLEIWAKASNPIVSPPCYVWHLQIDRNPTYYPACRYPSTFTWGSGFNTVLSSICNIHVELLASNEPWEISVSYTNSKVHGANMGPAWALVAPDGPHVGPMNLAIRVELGLWACIVLPQNHPPTSLQSPLRYDKTSCI